MTTLSEKREINFLLKLELNILLLREMERELQGLHCRGEPQAIDRLTPLYINIYWLILPLCNALLIHQIKTYYMKLLHLVIFWIKLKLNKERCNRTEDQCSDASQLDGCRMVATNGKMAC